MTSTSAYAVYDASYPQRTPYLTSTEYNNAPTAMDVNNLIAGGSAQANATALTETINRACSWIDQFCLGAWGSLTATQNTENARVWGNRYGQIVVHPKYWPILSVDAVSYAPMGAGIPSSGASITPSGNVWIEPMQFVISSSGGTTAWTSGGLTGNWGWGGGGIGVGTCEYFVNFTYTNGWPNTTLAASVAAGATSIQPSNVTGIYPGTPLTLYDLPLDEPAVVASTYTIGSSTVPLTAPLQYAHSTTATVTNLPPAIKQAAILATTAFIKQRGSGALEVADMGAVTRQITGLPQNAGSDWAEAEQLLNAFKMQYIGY